MKSKKYIRDTFPKISIVQIKGENFYRVDARKQGTNGKREHFLDKAEAETRAKEIAGEVEKHGTESLNLSQATRATVAKWEPVFVKQGKTVEDACQFFNAHLQAEIAKHGSKTIEALAEEWLQYKIAEGKKALTIKGIRQHVNLLKREHGTKKLSDMGKVDWLKWMNAQKVGATRWNALKNLTGQFYNFCILMEHTAVNPLAALKKQKDTTNGAKINILTPAQAEAALKLCSTSHKDFTLYYAISLFAGLRPTECELLKWEQIHLEEKQITVLDSTSKVNETRNVPIEDNLLAWLQAFQGERKGYVTPHVVNTGEHCRTAKQSNLRKRLQAVRVALGYKIGVHNPEGETWEADTLRHSYASYWLAKYNDRAHLAENMGNTVKVIKKHYKAVVSKSATAAYWNLTPSTV